jgi:hypothetical protein
VVSSGIGSLAQRELDGLLERHGAPRCPRRRERLFRFDSSGNVTQLYIEGTLEIVPLPDGSFFMAAGRVNVAADGFPSIALIPDNGATINLAGLCAALSP